MKKSIAITATILLAACSQSQAPTEPSGEANGAVAGAQAPAAAAMTEATMAGTYDVTMANGTTSINTIDADGNYVNMSGDKEIGRGKVVIANGQTCFNSAEKGSAPDCWTEGAPAADGSWVSTSDSGETVTVKKRAVAAAQ